MKQRPNPEPKPSKRLGQHFLRAEWVAREFMRYVCGHNRVLEIGVGTCYLSSRIAGCVGELVGLELDTRLVPYMGFYQVLEPSFDAVVSDALSPPIVLSRFDVVYGSIPYNITSPLLSLLARYFRGRVVLLVQNEVARRLAAKPGTSDYGRLTILVNLCYEVKLGRVVPPQAFTPPPRVMSRIVVLEPREKRPSEKELDAVERITSCLFAERNKLAYKVVRKCLGVNVEWIVGKRVRDLTPWEVLRLVEVAGDDRL